MIIVTDYCKQNYKQLGFTYDKDRECWRYSFPVHFWEDHPVLFCRVYLSNDLTRASYDVMDTFNNLYTPFYGYEYGRYGDFIKKAKNKIRYRFKTLGIVKKKEKKKNGHRKSSKSKVSCRRS